MKLILSEDDIERLKKKNRIKRLSTKTHKVHHESGRSTKSLWRRIIERSRGK
ncbi:hypothetical protein HYZ70_00360 [Candidatus Curtissbacteria bacterium]|nr:hypothetical protein [Candidatus Curtissbacteria bacterium]